MPDQNPHPVNRPATLVVCIGNELVADDAVGYHIYRQLQQQNMSEKIRLEYCAVGGIILLELLSGAEKLLIVVDAVQLGALPGTLHIIPWEKLPVNKEHAVSAHGIGLKDTIAIGQTLYPERIPERIILIGVEGQCFDQLGGEMTPQVKAAIPAAIRAIHRKIQEEADE